MPTGAEWEYAARAGTRTSVPTGDVVEHAPLFVCAEDAVLEPIAWYCANSGMLTHPVGQKQANAWGLHDMFGNAEEWTMSNAAPYGPGPLVDHDAELTWSRSQPTPSALIRVRGGAWNRWSHGLRAGAAPGSPPDGKGPGLGFRLVQTIP